MVSVQRCWLCRQLELLFGNKPVIQERQAAFQSSTSRQTISADNYLCFFFFPSPFFSILLSSPKPADADWGSEKQRSPRATKNIVPKTRSRKAWCYLFRRYPHLHPRRRVNTQLITKCHATATASAIVT